MTTIKSVTNEEALSYKREPTEELTIIDFFASWCQPCKNLIPTLEGLASQYNIVKVDVDKCSEAVASYGVRGIPTLIAIKNGVVLDTRVGNASKTELEEWFESVKTK